MFANREALDHYRAALALGHPDPAGVHAAVGDLETLLGNYDAALAAYTEAAAEAGDADRWVIERKLGAVCARRGDWDAAERHLTAALAALGPGGAEGGRAGLAADRPPGRPPPGRDDAATQLANDALDLAGEAGDPDALARAHGMLGMLGAARGDHDTARRHLEQSLALAEALPTPAPGWRPSTTWPWPCGPARSTWPPSTPGPPWSSAPARATATARRPCTTTWPTCCTSAAGTPRPWPPQAGGGDLRRGRRARHPGAGIWKLVSW